MAVAASWAGVPFIGATALGAAGVAASQGRLDLALVVGVVAPWRARSAASSATPSVTAGAASSWSGRASTRPAASRWSSGVSTPMPRWGRLAVFFTPAIVSGTAKMKHGQFVLWNLLASFGFAVSVAASAYGIGRIFTGHDSPHDIVTLLVGLAVGVLVTVLYVRHRPPRRRPARRVSGAGRGSARR